MGREVRVKGWLVFTFFLALYLASMGKGPYSTDGEIMLRTAWAIVDRHELAIPCSSRLPKAVRGFDGRCYSSYGLGQPLASVPLLLLGKGFRVLWPQTDYAASVSVFMLRLNQLVTAAICTLVFYFASTMYNSSRLGLGLAVAYGVGTMAWPYSKFYFSSPLCTLCLLAAAYSLFTFRRQGGTRRLALAGACLGYAWLTQEASLIVLPFYVAYVLPIGSFIESAHARIVQTICRNWMPAKGPNLRDAGSRRHGLCCTRGLLAFLFPASLFLAADLAYNYYAFRSPLLGGYFQEHWSTPLYQGLWGLLFSPGKSLLLYVPVTSLVPWSLRALYRRGYRSESLLFSGILGAYVLFHATWWSWYGGWSWGPRFLVATLPFLVLPLGSLWSRGRVARIALLSLIVTSVFVQVLGVAIDFNQYMLAVNDLTKLLYVPRYSPVVGHLLMLLQEGPADLSGGDLLAAGLPPLAIRLFQFTCGLVALVSGVSMWRAVGVRRGRRQPRTTRRGSKGPGQRTSGHDRPVGLTWA